MNRTQKTATRAGQRGSAALEVLLLLPFILLIFSLIVVMGYNAERKREAQAALRLAGYSYVDALGEQNKDQARQTAEALVNAELFPGENNAATVTVSGVDKKPAEAGGVDSEYQNTSKENNSLLGSLSSRTTVAIRVTRTPPYPDLVNNSPIETQYLVSSNTWTYCEMQDDDFGGGLDALSKVDFISGYALWVFGGCGGDTLGKCENECK